MKYYTTKKKMYLVAKPIIDIFLSEKTERKRRKILKKVVANTSADKVFADMGSNFSLEEVGVGGMHINFRLKFFPFIPFRSMTLIGKHNGMGSSIYAHELGHALGIYAGNHYVLAHAFESYFRAKEYGIKITDEFNQVGSLTKREISPIFKVGEDGESLLYVGPKRIKPLTILEKCLHSSIELEYSSDRHFPNIGAYVGSLAAQIEQELEIPSLGLYFLKMVDRGIPMQRTREIIKEKHKKHLIRQKIK